MHRFLIIAAGLLGAGGVALLASAAHIGGDSLGTAAGFMLAHAPVLLAVGLAGGRAHALAALVVLAGVALFAGDLTLRDLTGARLFPMAAPSGGMLTILGWLGIAVSALFRPGRQDPDGRKDQGFSTRAT